MVKGIETLRMLFHCEGLSYTSNEVHVFSMYLQKSCGSNRRWVCVIITDSYYDEVKASDGAAACCLFNEQWNGWYLSHCRSAACLEDVRLCSVATLPGFDFYTVTVLSALNVEMTKCRVSVFKSLVQLFEAPRLKANHHIPYFAVRKFRSDTCIRGVTETSHSSCTTSQQVSHNRVASSVLCADEPSARKN